jgi:hypothetical protein
MAQTSLETAVRASIQSQCAKLLQLRRLYRSACIAVYENLAREQHRKAKLTRPRSADPAKEKAEAAAHCQAALADAILAAMSSLTDYYAMLCAIRIGIPEQNITLVQHDWIKRPFLSSKKADSEKKEPRDAFKEFLAAYKEKWKEYSDTDRPGFWLELHAASIEERLKKLGVKLIGEHEKNLPGWPLKQVSTYFHYIQPLISNAFTGEGLRYQLYSEINNVIKHNINQLPRITAETFDSDQHWYTYIEISESNRPFLKEGVLRRLLSIDFDQLRTWLSEHQHARPDICPIAQHLGIGARITIDTENGISSPDQATLYFLIDTVLVGKRRDGILIEAGKTLSGTAAMLCDTVLRGPAMESQPAHCCAG